MLFGVPSHMAPALANGLTHADANSMSIECASQPAHHSRSADESGSRYNRSRHMQQSWKAYGTELTLQSTLRRLPTLHILLPTMLFWLQWPLEHI